AGVAFVDQEAETLRQRHILGKARAGGNRLHAGCGVSLALAGVAQRAAGQDADRYHAHAFLRRAVDQLPVILEGKARWRLHAAHGVEQIETCLYGMHISMESLYASTPFSSSS